MSKVINKKLHPYYKTGIYGWIGEEVDDNDYIICPICGDVLGMNYWDYSAENNGDNKCPKCKQELDYSEIYDFEDTCYFDQLVEIKNQHIADLEATLSLTEKALELACFYYHHDSCSNCDCDENCSSCTNMTAETLLESIKKEAKEIMKGE